MQVCQRGAWEEEIRVARLHTRPKYESKLRRSSTATIKHRKSIVRRKLIGREKQGGRSAMHRRDYTRPAEVVLPLRTACIPSLWDIGSCAVLLAWREFL